MSVCVYSVSVLSYVGSGHGLADHPCKESYNQSDGTFHNHSCENLKFYDLFKISELTLNGNRSEPLKVEEKEEEEDHHNVTYILCWVPSFLYRTSLIQTIF
jgi:hypothetical protein